MQEIAIAGPGLMGLGIAQVCAAAGLHVWLVGRDAASAQAGHRRLGEQFARQVEKGRLDAAAATAMLRRIEPVRDPHELARCAMAVESVPEDRARKHSVLRLLETSLAPGALIATNTSGLPVSGLAGALRGPERFLGLHFFSPVQRMALVEVVRGELTAQATLREALALVERLLNLQQIAQARSDGLPPDRCRPLAEPVLTALVALGRRGRREGGGFYETAEDGRRVPWRGLTELFPRAPRQPDPARISSRLRCAEVMDALRCLEVGVIESADEADTASVLGLGFPRVDGGVLRWAEARGLPWLVGECDALAKEHGARFAPSEWLRRLAAAGAGLREFRNPLTQLSVPA